MKRVLIGLFAALALAACSSGTPTTTVNGQLSANTREAVARKGTGTTRAPRPTTTRAPRTPRTTRTSRPTETSVPTPTTPTIPPTPSQSGVAGAVLYETNCASDRPCSLSPGPAQVQLRNAKGKVLASASASSHGAFVIPVAPGTYTLVAVPPSRKQKCAPIPITVEDGHYATVQVTCGAK